MIRTVAVVGANGQVGSEVCLFLTQFEGLRVVPICRDRLGSAFLRSCGLRCRHGRVDDPGAASALLVGADVVVDCTLPKGTYGQMQDQIRRIVDGISSSAPEGASLIYVSSMMAYGMGAAGYPLRWHVVPRTQYGAVKRFAERCARRASRRSGRGLFVLRLGQVHGELQSVSTGMRRSMRSRAVVPSGPSYSVFCFSIAEAIAHIAFGLESPGTYTLVSSPAWSWKEVLEYHSTSGGGRVSVTEADVRGGVSAGAQVREWGRRLGASSLTHIGRHRELLLPLLSWGWPKLESRLRAHHAIRSARSAMAAQCQAQTWRPFDIFVGVVPGRRLRTLSDSRVAMGHSTDRVRALLAGAAPVRS